MDATTISGTGGRRRDRSLSRPRASIAGVLGEILITAGVIVLLYVVWQMWVGDWIYAAARSTESTALSQQWQREYEASDDGSEPEETDPAGPAQPVILPEAADGEVFGALLIPRFGENYSFPIAGGVSRARTLDPIGVGHYPGSPMPGDIGNVALAGHRMTWGGPFLRLPELRIDDAIVIETPDGWYTYRFRSLEYVTPTSVDVLLPTPRAPDAEPTGRYLSLTTCSPLYSMAERLIGYAVFDDFTPRSDGAPASLTLGDA